ncbi:hypothetical protein KIPB_014000, partial [Kipferlia bialata]|eukprot:g14000.t1
MMLITLNTQVLAGGKLRDLITGDTITPRTVKGLLSLSALAMSGVQVIPADSRGMKYVLTEAL